MHKQEFQMPPIPVVLERTATKNIEVSLSPTHSIFSSMLLLAKGDQPPGIHDWINNPEPQKVRYSSIFFDFVYPPSCSVYSCCCH